MVAFFRAEVNLSNSIHYVMSCKLFVTHLHNVRSSQAWLVMLPFGKIPTQPHVFIMYIFFRLHSYQLFV